MNPEERITKLEERLALAEARIAQLERPSFRDVYQPQLDKLKPTNPNKVWAGDPDWVKASGGHL